MPPIPLPFGACVDSTNLGQRFTNGPVGGAPDLVGGAPSRVSAEDTLPQAFPPVYVWGDLGALAVTVTHALKVGGVSGPSPDITTHALRCDTWRPCGWGGYLGTDSRDVWTVWARTFGYFCGPDHQLGTIESVTFAGAALALEGSGGTAHYVLPLDLIDRSDAALLAGHTYDLAIAASYPSGCNVAWDGTPGQGGRGVSWYLSIGQQLAFWPCGAHGGSKFHLG